MRSHPFVVKETEKTELEVGETKLPSAKDCVKCTRTTGSHFSIDLNIHIYLS